MTARQRRGKGTAKGNVPMQRLRRKLRSHGLTVAEYDARLAAQGGTCAICGRGNGRRRLCVDHDHRTGRGRGLLCSRCNAALGLLDDSPERLRVAAAYLASWSTGK